MSKTIKKILESYRYFKSIIPNYNLVNDLFSFYIPKKVYFQNSCIGNVEILKELGIYI